MRLLVPLILGTWATAMAEAPPFERVAEKKLLNGDRLLECKLKNGLRVLHVPRHQAKVLSFQIWFDVGSVDEKLDPKLNKTGLAHLFEHMMFRGTEKYPDGKFDEITARIGGDRQNATTHFYRTNYFENIPSHQLEPLMEIESDRMRNLRLTKDLFEKEKGAVVGEFRRHMDSPPSVAFDELLNLMYAVAPYRWTVLGTEGEIKGFSLEEAQYFYKTFYAPNNAVLIVTGDVNEEKLMDLVVKYYGGMAPQEIPKTTVPGEPPQKKERRFERTHTQASADILLIGYTIGPVTSTDFVPMSLLGAHLSMGTEARLRKLLVDTGIAVSANGAPSSQPDTFEFYVQLAEKHRAEEALKIIDAEIDSLKRKPVSREHFERALNLELLDLYERIADNHSLGSVLGEYLMLSDNYMRGFEIIEAYKTIGPTDIQRVIKKYMNRDTRCVVMVRPEKKKKS